VKFTKSGPCLSRRLLLAVRVAAPANCGRQLCQAPIENILGRRPSYTVRLSGSSGKLRRVLPDIGGKPKSSFQAANAFGVVPKEPVEESGHSGDCHQAHGGPFSNLTLEASHS